MSWPEVNVREGKLEGFNFEIDQKGEEECNIKEIIMVYAWPDDIIYNENDVALSVTYDTEFGMHTILFSKVNNMPYTMKRHYMTYKLTSLKTEPISFDSKYVPEEALTKMFQNMLTDAKPCVTLAEEEREVMDKVAYESFLSNVYHVEYCFSCSKILYHPYVNLKEGKLEGFEFKKYRCNEVDCKKSDMVIKEILIGNNLFNAVSYNASDIPLIVNYEHEERGTIFIMFSKVANLSFNLDIAIDGLHIFKILTSAENKWGRSIPEETLTKMFHHVLEEVL